MSVGMNSLICCVGPDRQSARPTGSLRCRHPLLSPRPTRPTSSGVEKT